MRNEEHAIREAMAADVADVVAPPDLAHRVRLRYRRHRRVRATGALAVLTVLAVAAPLLTTEVRQGLSPADRPAVDEVDGVELTYLPDGLRRDPVDGFNTHVHQWRAVTGRWYPESMTGPEKYQHGVRVTVYRGTWVDFSEDRRILRYLTRTIYPIVRPVREEGGRVYFRSLHDSRWTDVLWPAGNDVTLRVRVSEEFAGDLDRIVRGLRVVGPGRDIVLDPGRQPPQEAGGLCAPTTNIELAGGDLVSESWARFGGVVLHHVPAGLDGPFLTAWANSGLADDPTPYRAWHLTFRWGRLPGQPDEVEVQVTCAADPEQQAMVRDNVQLSLGADAQPYTLPGGRAGFVDRELDGITVAWSEPSGAVVQLRVDHRYAEELDEILAGIEIVNP